ncbi:hypothetical protein SDC9_126198 [bioreactor metagenome]|uniref:Uncharacterized protein n=1 Tax=bioreactor metagenome TaxID=1076179 RepID=A0A645CQI7_9ZZZZ
MTAHIADVDGRRVVGEFIIPAGALVEVDGCARIVAAHDLAFRRLGGRGPAGVAAVVFIEVNEVIGAFLIAAGLVILGIARTVVEPFPLVVGQRRGDAFAEGAAGGQNPRGVIVVGVTVVEFAVGLSGHGRDVILALAGVDELRQTDLFEFVDAVGIAGAFPRRRQCREQHGRQNGDDGNYD